MTAHDLNLWFHEHVCGCGEPGDVASLMHEVLGVLDTLHSRSYSENRTVFATLLPGRCFYTVLNYYDGIGLLEHGGSIMSSWLTPLGEQVLEALNEHGTDPDKWGEHCHASSDRKCMCGQPVPEV